MKPKASILIVEDDSVIAAIEEWRLKKMGYEVCGHATNGDDALDLIRTRKPDLVLLDITIEGDMDGIEIGRFLDTQTSIPFVFLTAHAEDAILKRVKGTLRYGYIKKPFTDDDLRIAIELGLSRSRSINRILASSALFQMAFDHVPLGFFITNTDGIILYANENARSLTQWQDPAGTTHLREVLKIVDRDHGRSLEDIGERVRNEQAAVWIPDHSVLESLKFSSIPIAGSAAPLFNDEGSWEGMIITLSAVAGERHHFRLRS